MKNNSLRVTVVLISALICFYLIKTVSYPLFLYIRYNNQMTFDNLQNFLLASPNSTGLNTLAGNMFLYDTYRKDPLKAYNYYMKALRGGGLISKTWENFSFILNEWNYYDASNKALEISSFVDPYNDKLLWTLSQNYILAGDKEKSLKYLSKFIELMPENYMDVYETAYKFSGDYDELYQKIVPKNVEQLSLFLKYLISEGEELTGKKIYGLLKNMPDLKSDILLAYMTFLVQKEDMETLNDAFDFTVKKLHYPQRDKNNSNLIYNNGFEFLPLNSGFDWIIIPSANVDVDFDGHTRITGDYSLRIEFKGSNVDFNNVYHHAQVLPATSYKLSFFVKTENITTANGFFVEVFSSKNTKDFYAASNIITGTNQWQEVTLDLNVPDNVKLITVRLRRLPSSKIDSKISGVVWVDNFKLIKGS